MKLTIYRDSWQRGAYDKKTRLLDPETDKLCCLGFLGLACGYDRLHLEGVGTPGGMMQCIPDLDDQWPKGILNEVRRNTALTNDLINANDSSFYHSPTEEANREERVRVLMAQVGVEVTFADGKLP